MPTPTPAPSFTLSLPDLIAAGGAPLYLTGDDALRLTVFNAAAGVTVTVSGRTLPFGESRPTAFSRTLTPTANRAASTLFVALGDGWLLNCQVIVTSGTPLDGQTWARLSLQRGDGAIGGEHFTLASDTITVGKALAWPGGFVRGPLDGAGAIRSIGGTTPGAGAEVSESVPTGARWQLLAFKVHFLASGVAGSRRAVFIIDDGANVLYESQTDATGTTAGGNFDIVYAPGIGDFRQSQVVQATIGDNIPNLALLTAGFRLRTVTGALDVGDQYSAVRYWVREWLEV